MLENIDPTKVLFLDVECVTGTSDFAELSPEMQKMWQIKSRSVLRKYDEEIDEKEAAAAYKDRGAIYAEFGKIVVISVGIVHRSKDGKLHLRLKSFASDNEKELLTDFAKMIEQYYNDPKKSYLCGHNIKEFDIPYICRRMVINGMKLPYAISLEGKKPWETQNLLDTLELWKFGDRKSYTSLALLSAVFGIPSPKDDIDGSEVGRVYWEETDLDRIATYCEKDVLATTQLFMKYKLLPLLEEEQVTVVA